MLTLDNEKLRRLSSGRALLAPLTSVSLGARVGAGRAPVPGAGAARLLAGVEQLPSNSGVIVTCHTTVTLLSHYCHTTVILLSRCHAAHLGTPTQSLVTPPLLVVHQNLLPAA